MPTARALAAAALTAAALALALAAAPRAQPPTADDDRTQIARTLDDLHDAASKANFDRYFALYTPRAVFLGTDATERWTIDEFKAYAKPHFDKGRGWTYLPRPNTRHIEVHENTAWFDEALDNAKYGQCRGSGVLIRQHDGRWKVAQYNLTVPIPNDLLADVAQMIRQREKKE